MSDAYRSMLLVPGHKEAWVDRALEAGPDALLLDLEDAVPKAAKAAARTTVATSITRLREAGTAVALWARANAWTSDECFADLEQIVTPGLRGLVLPKVRDLSDLHRYDAVLSYLEDRSGMDRESVGVILELETATAMVACEELARGPRVVSLVCATARDGDVARALGFQFTAHGDETLYLRSKVQMACRAAGIEQTLCGVWSEIADLDGLRTFAMQQRRIGYRGQVVLHPSHVTVVNEVFSPSPDELEFYRELLAAFESAEASGDGAVVYRGEHVNYAHAETARQVLLRAAGTGP